LDQAFAVTRTFQPLTREQLSTLLEKTHSYALAGHYELFKTTTYFDSTIKHPEWLGKDPDWVKDIKPNAS
jgi:hypothetical protein